MNSVIILNDFIIQEFFYSLSDLTESCSMGHLSYLDSIESLLYTCDLELLKQRQVLVQTLKSVENGMDDRENFIKE
jgi:hypothetical protein